MCFILSTDDDTSRSTSKGYQKLGQGDDSKETLTAAETEDQSEEAEEDEDEEDEEEEQGDGSEEETDSQDSDSDADESDFDSDSECGEFHHARMQGGPPPCPKICSKSCSFQAILREKTLYILSKFWAQGPPIVWGQNSTGPLTKILDPPLFILCSCMGCAGFLVCQDRFEDRKHFQSFV